MKKGLVGVLLAFAVVLVFAPNGWNSFVRFDDMDYVAKNPHIEHGLNVRLAKWAFLPTGYADNWHPLTWISHAADVSIADALGLDGRNPNAKYGVWAKLDSSFARFAHWVNILFHAANAVLLWLLMLRLLSVKGDEPADVRLSILAALCAAFWAIHPLRVEVVAWVSERKELLSVFFMLLALHCYIGGFRFSRFCSLVSFGLALLAKPVAVTLPALLLAWEWVAERRSLREAIGRTFVYFLLSFVTCVFTMGAQTTARLVGRLMTPFNHMMCVIMSPAVYAWQTLVPYGLTMDYPDPHLSTCWPFAAAGLVLLAAMVAVCVWWLVRPNRWNRLGALAVAWCYVELLPMIGIVRVGPEPHSDRYTYWIGCGAVVVLFWVASRLVRFWRPYERKFFTGIAIALVVYAALTVRQSAVWKDTISLFSDAVEKTHSDDLTISLMDEYCLTGGQDGGKKAEKLIRGSPSNTPAARAGLALYLARISYVREEPGQYAEARLLAEGALEEDPYCCYAHAALGILHARGKNYAKAVEHVSKALECGYENLMLADDLRKWREILAKEKGCGDVQR